MLYKHKLIVTSKVLIKYVEWIFLNTVFLLVSGWYWCYNTLAQVISATNTLHLFKKWKEICISSSAYLPGTWHWRYSNTIMLFQGNYVRLKVPWFWCLCCGNLHCNSVWENLYNCKVFIMFILTGTHVVSILAQVSLVKPFKSRCCIYQIYILGRCLQIYSEVFKIISLLVSWNEMKKKLKWKL